MSAFFSLSVPVHAQKIATRNDFLHRGAHTWKNLHQQLFEGCVPRPKVSHQVSPCSHKRLASRAPLLAKSVLDLDGCHWIGGKDQRKCSSRAYIDLFNRGAEDGGRIRPWKRFNQRSEKHRLNVMHVQSFIYSYLDQWHVLIIIFVELFNS